jgi:hypothetical protein
MATKPFTIETLLEGKEYRSLNRYKVGVIQNATKRDNVYYGSAWQAYTVQVTPEDNSGDFYATVAVKVGDE